MVPADLLDRVVAYFRPRRVILFGSTARGEAGPDSDIDLLVVVDDDTPDEQVTIRAGTRLGRVITSRLTFFPYGMQRFSANAGLPARCRERRFRRESLSMSEPDPRDVWSHAQDRIGIASADQCAARLCIVADILLLDIAT